MSDTSSKAEILAAGVLMGQAYNTLVDDMSLADAFDMQDAVTERLADARGGRGGWKIAWNVPHLMEKFGMPHPGMGQVFNDEIHYGDTNIALKNYQSLMIEAEIVARLSGDLGPGAEHTPQSVANAVEGFTVGYEVLDRRNSPPEAKAAGILAQNVFNAGAVIGDSWVSVDDLDTARITTRMSDGDEVVVEGAAMTPQAPLEAIAFLANHFSARGITMKAGDIVLCGSHIPLYPVETHTKFVLSMGPLGAVSLLVS